MGTEAYKQLLEQLSRIEHMTILSSKNVLTINDVVVLTGLTKSFIYRLTSKQKIPHYKPSGKFLFFKKQEIEEWMLQNRVSTMSEIDSMATTYTVTHKH